MKTTFFSAQPKDKLVSIIIDKMSLKKLVSYNSQNDQFYGFEDFGDTSVINLKNDKICDQVLVVMINSWIMPWKQVIGHYLSSGPVSGQNWNTQYSK